jgi:hypothetical protein
MDLDGFVAGYNPKNRHERKESDRFKSFAYDDLLKRDKVNLDIFWLKDESLEESANLPAPEVIARRSPKTCKPPWNNSPLSPKILVIHTTPI